MRPLARGWAALCATAVVLASASGGIALAQEAPSPTDELSDLVLLLDGSGSIDANDWSLQLQGYAAALQDRVNFPVDGSVAVSVIQWSYRSFDTPATRVEVPLTVLSSAADVDRVVAQVRAIAQIGFSTNPGDALRAGTDQLVANGRAGAQWTLCMSTDGVHNSGEYLSSALQHARSSGVDRYSVVAVEDPGFTAQDAVWAYGPHVFGGGTLTVARTTTEFTSLISGCAADPVRLEALEVTQSVQDWDNRVPLVAVKPTVVRAYLETLEGDPVRTSGRLRGFAGGVELPGSPVTALNGSNGVLVDGDAAVDRSSLDDTLNFALPPSWTRAGVTELSLELPGGVSCDAGARVGASLCGQNVLFQSGFAADVQYRGLSWTEGDTTEEPTFADLYEQHARSVSQLPTAGWSAGYSMLAVDGRPDDLGDVNEALDTARRLADGPAEQRWYGVIPGNDGGGLASGRVASGWDSDREGVREGGHARNRVVHELGHTYGLHHSVNAEENGYTQILWVFDHLKRGWCGEVADRDAEDYPDTTTIGGRTVAALGPVGEERTEVWGMDPRYIGVSEDLALSAPQTNTSLMSYCVGTDPTGQSRWIGQRDYEQLLSGDRAPISGDDVTPGTGLALRAVIAADGLSAELKPALAVEQGPTPSRVDGTHELVLLDSTGAVRHSTRFTPVTSHGEPVEGGQDVAGDVSLAHVVVPADLAGATRVELRTDGRVLATGTTTPAAPAVSVGVPTAGSAERVSIGWTSSDADSPGLRHTVLYSADGGASWQALAVDVRGDSLSVARPSMPGSPDARLRVIASDGLRSTVATSAAFSWPDLAPAVQVTAPVEGTVLTGAQSFVLQAEAQDAEDGRLDGGSVTWSSDRNGVLGTGSRLVQRADLLAEGRHVLTATARDRTGQQSTASVTVTVQRVAAPPVPPRSPYVFGGFEPPVGVAGERFNAGRTIPVKWSVTGEAVTDATVVSAGFLTDGATYDLRRSGSTWHLNASTPKTWAGTAQTFRVVLDDGTSHDVSLPFS